MKSYGCTEMELLNNVDIHLRYVIGDLTHVMDVIEAIRDEGIDTSNLEEATAPLKECKHTVRCCMLAVVDVRERLKTIPRENLEKIYFGDGNKNLLDSIRVNLIDVINTLDSMIVDVDNIKTVDREDIRDIINHIAYSSHTANICKSAIKELMDDKGIVMEKINRVEEVKVPNLDKLDNIEASQHFGSSPDYLGGTMFRLSVCDKENIDKNHSGQINLGVTFDGAVIYSTLDKSDLRAIAKFFNDFADMVDNGVEKAKLARIKKMDKEIEELVQKRNEYAKSVMQKDSVDFVPLTESTAAVIELDAEEYKKSRPYD